MAFRNCKEKIKYLWRGILAKPEGNQVLALETKWRVPKLPQEVRYRIDAVSAAAGGLSANLAPDGSRRRARLILPHSLDGQFFVTLDVDFDQSYKAWIDAQFRKRRTGTACWQKPIELSEGQGEVCSGNHVGGGETAGGKPHGGEDAQLAETNVAEL